MTKKKAIILISVFVIVFIIGYIYISLFEMENGYAIYETPFVRSCQIDSDCQGFAKSCVNHNFQPKKQEIISSAFPLWEFNDKTCVCKDYTVINLCEKK